MAYRGRMMMAVARTVDSQPRAVPARTSFTLRKVVVEGSMSLMTVRRGMNIMKEKM